MNNDREISEIRRLLELYYAGETTPEQVQRLSRLLTDASELPNELAREARLMSLLDKAGDALDEVLPPDGLEERLTAITAVTDAPSRSRGGLWAWLSAAAAAAIVFGVIIWPSAEMTQPAAMDNACTATASEHMETASALPTASKAETSAEIPQLLKPEPVPEASIAKAETTQRLKKAHSAAPEPTAKAETRDDNYYVEVGNPEQAARISDDALRLLASTLNAQLSSLNNLPK